jgi:hypothetical protein
LDGDRSLTDWPSGEQPLTVANHVLCYMNRVAPDQTDAPSFPAHVDDISYSDEASLSASFWHLIHGMHTESHIFFSVFF